MDSNPQLPNHLLRDLMHVIRRTNDGDALIRFALSGKEPFSVFRFVVKNCTKAVTHRDRVFIQNVSPVPAPFNARFTFSKKASQALVLRFVREVHAISNLAQHIPLDQITRLTIDNYDNQLFSSNSIICSKSDPVLKMFYISDGFLDDLISGTASLTNLQKLEFGFTSKQLVKLMSTPSSFSLPEDVTLSIDVGDDALSNLVCLKTFPTVRHLDVNILLHDQLTSALLHKISAFIDCFTGLETAKIGFFYNHHLDKIDFDEVETFHKWLRGTSFPVPVEVSFSEYVQNALKQHFNTFCEQLKSIGYKESKFVVIRQFLIAKKYDNVKLTHFIRIY
uniref:F-box domain-containing protein n=1 Tax=Panagrellus redivivus TaxID=6233 RepID=A0A7E4W1S8_PANRE